MINCSKALDRQWSKSFLTNLVIVQLCVLSFSHSHTNTLLEARGTLKVFSEPTNNNYILIDTLTVLYCVPYTLVLWAYLFGSFLLLRVDVPLWKQTRDCLHDAFNRAFAKIGTKTKVIWMAHKSQTYFTLTEGLSHHYLHRWSHLTSDCWLLYSEL